jgi:phosphatidylglycerol:prolipoprotein diacylglycerol transferase
MWPVLFWKIDTYYVIWSAALVLMVLWTKRRAVLFYGISGADASDILAWVLTGVFIGATVGGYLNRLGEFAENPAKLLRFWEVGVSSGPGFIGGGLFGMYKIRRSGVFADGFAESSSIPCCFMLFIGRWGCFANGCCKGLPTASKLGVKFPTAPHSAVWPSQLFESMAALLIGLLLVAIEFIRFRRGMRANRAILFPIFLVTYGAYRIAFDFLREGGGPFGLHAGQYSGILACLFGACWLARSVRRGATG